MGRSPGTAPRKLQEAGRCWWGLAAATDWLVPVVKEEVEGEGGIRRHRARCRDICNHGTGALQREWGELGWLAEFYDMHILGKPCVPVHLGFRAGHGDPCSQCWLCLLLPGQH